jgi:hypothetical protein
MKISTVDLTARHRLLEPHLDRLLAAIGTQNCEEQIRLTVPLVVETHSLEEPFLKSLAEFAPAVAAKMTAQHAEAREIAFRLEEAMTQGQRRDVLLLARRFHAIVQHNIIEEERDVFPLCDR